ncbi:LacI family DNA-binding transcriptional regulator [Roseibium sp. RKSG952]|nr:LacI family DNA-binding transcriptional regulator [Roseibium sp. RKSG952]
MKDVAEKAGVSVMTVSRAFKADTSVNEDKRRRILSIADSMGYVFDSTASNLRSQKSGFVAVIVPTISNPNFADTVDELSNVVSAAGLQVLLGYDRYDLAEEERLIARLLGRRPEAIVVTGGRHTERGERLLREAGIPVIETWDMPDKPIGHVVGFSNRASSAQMVAHLVADGRKNIAFIGGDFDGDSRGMERRHGFLDAMKQAGLEPAALIPLGGPSDFRNGAAAMAQLLDTCPETDAVIGVFDHAAFGALTECQRRNIRVPEDIAIAGFGATDIAAVSVPGLTTLDPRASEIGQRAGELIIDLLYNPSTAEAPGIHHVNPVLKVGQSTAHVSAKA